MKLLAAIAAAALITACDARIGNDAPPVDANATAAGRAEEGRLTVEAPGLNLSINIPDSIQARAHVDEDSGLIYPGSEFVGMHVQGRPEKAGESDGEVEMRFASADAPERIAAWYRDPGRSGDLTVESARQEGNAFVISGTGRRDNERFTVRIAPRAGGGSETRLLLADAH